MRDIVVTDRAIEEAEAAFPPDIIELDQELREIVRSLVPSEFQFAQRKMPAPRAKQEVSWVDVYRIDFEGCDIWLKLKLEQDKSGDLIVIISCHKWDDSIPI